MSVRAQAHIICCRKIAHQCHLICEYLPVSLGKRIFRIPTPKGLLRPTPTPRIRQVLHCWNGWTANLGTINPRNTTAVDSSFTRTRLKDNFDPALNWNLKIVHATSQTFPDSPDTVDFMALPFIASYHGQQLVTAFTPKKLRNAEIFLTLVAQRLDTRLVRNAHAAIPSGNLIVRQNISV